MYLLSAALVTGHAELVQAVQNCLRDARVRLVLALPEITRWAEFLLQLERLQPGVVILDLAPRLEDIIRRIRTVSQAPVIVMHDAVDAETILAVVRAGAREYVYPPYEPGLAQALERVARERAEQAVSPGAGGQLVGVLSAKGGCGATTIACHLAPEMRRLTQKEILLADLELSGGGVGFVMNADSPCSIVDAASNLERLDLSFWKGLISNGIPRLEVIRAPQQPLVSAPPPPERFREVLRFARSNYDWVIVDLGRSLNYFTLSLIAELDQVLLVTTPEVPAFYQTKNLVQALRQQGYGEERIRLLMNRAAKGGDFAISQVERLVGLPVYLRLPNSYPELYRALAEGRLLTPDTALGKQFTHLAAGLVGIPHAGKPPSTAPLLGVKRMVAGWGGSA